MATLLDALDRVVAARGDALAVRDREGAVAYTWTALRDASRRVAGGLAGLGVAQGDGVGLLLDNRPEFHVADLAVVTLGAVPVSLYNTAAPEQIAYIIDDAGLKVVITQASHAETARAAIGDRAVTLVVLEEPSWSSLVEAPPVAAPAAVTPGDLLTIIYTSGTTGPPKGVELTHANLMTATETVGSFNGLALGAEGAGRVICWLPLAHIAERIASYCNARLSRVEQVKRHEILATAWPPGGDELTPTLKLKRSPIATKYASLIDDLYAEVPR